MFEQNPSAESRYFNVLCAEGNFSHRKSVLAAWLALFPEYSDQLHLEQHVCFCSGCPKNELGDYVPPGSTTPGGITTYIEPSAMPTLRKLMPNSLRSMMTRDLTSFDTFPVL